MCFCPVPTSELMTVDLWSVSSLGRRWMPERNTATANMQCRSLRQRVLDRPDGHRLSSTTCQRHVKQCLNNNLYTIRIKSVCICLQTARGRGGVVLPWHWLRAKQATAAAVPRVHAADSYRYEVIHRVLSGVLHTSHNHVKRECGS